MTSGILFLCLWPKAWIKIDRCISALYCNHSLVAKFVLVTACCEAALSIVHFFVAHGIGSDKNHSPFYLHGFEAPAQLTFSQVFSKWIWIHTATWFLQSTRILQTIGTVLYSTGLNVTSTFLAIFYQRYCAFLLCNSGNCSTVLISWNVFRIMKDLQGLLLRLNIP